MSFDQSDKYNVSKIKCQLIPENMFNSSKHTMSESFQLKRIHFDETIEF